MTINSITQLEKLKTAISGLHERHPPAGVNVEIWRRSQHDLVRSRDNLLTGSILGFTFPAYRAVAQLSSSIRFACPDFKRGVNSEVALGKVSEYLLDNANTLTSKALTKIDLDSLETHWRSWLAQVGAEATHLVPCAIIPYPSASFRIGPVRFIQIEQLTSTDVCAKNDESFLSAMEGLKKMLAERHANWIAVTAVSGAEPTRSGEIANRATDIALAGLQIVLNQDSSRYIARLTGRSLPPHLRTVTISAGQVSHSITNNMPGLALNPQEFHSALHQAAPYVEAIGNRISAYLSVGNPFGLLQQAWCDAAFWCQQALAEELDTLRVAKLEVSLETLFASGDSRGSTSRLLNFLDRVLGLQAEAPIFRDAPKTTKEFVSSLVTARSRILHGTWSTLIEELPINSNEVAQLCRHLLLLYTIKLDRYMLNAGGSDTIAEFVDWMLLQPPCGQG